MCITRMNIFGFLQTTPSEYIENFSRQSLPNATHSCKYPYEYTLAKSFTAESDYHDSYNACYSCKPAVSWMSVEKSIRSKEKENPAAIQLHAPLAEKQTQTPPTQCSVDYTPKTRFSDSYVSEYSTGFVQHNSAAAQMLRGTTCRQRDQPLCSGPLHTVTTSQDSFRDLSPAYLHPDRTGSFQYQSSLRRSLGQPPHGDITPPTSLPITNTCDNAQSNRFTLRDCGFPDFAQPENVSMYSQSFVKSPENYKPPKSCKGSGALTSGGGHFFSRTESKEAFNGLGIDERHPLTFSIPSCHQYERAQANSESVMENINSVRKHLLRSAMPLLRSLPAGNPDFYTIKEKHTTDQECISSLHHEAKEASAARISRRVDCSLPSQCSSLTKFGDHTTYSVEYPWLTGRRPEPQLPLNHDMKSLITYDHNGPSTSTYKDAYLQRDYIRRNGMTENDYHLKKG